MESERFAGAIPMVFGEKCANGRKQQVDSISLVT